MGHEFTGSTRVLCAPYGIDLQLNSQCTSLIVEKPRCLSYYWMSVDRPARITQRITDSFKQLFSPSHHPRRPSHSTAPERIPFLENSLASGSGIELPNRIRVGTRGMDEVKSWEVNGSPISPTDRKRDPSLRLQALSMGPEAPIEYKLYKRRFIGCVAMVRNQITHHRCLFTQLNSADFRWL